MYDLRFVYVVVKIEKKDYMKDQLCGDLERFGAPLYPVERKDSIEYKGLLKVRDFNDLETFVAMSPYGAGYDITVDGVPYRDYGLYPWKRVRGIA